MEIKIFKKLSIFIALFLILDFSLFFLLKSGLDKYYGFGKSPDILIIGSSASLSGYDVDVMETALDKKVSLYAQEGSSLMLRYIMLNHFLTSNKGSVTTVLFEVSPRNFFDRGLAANSHKLFYPYLDDTVIKNYIVSEETKPSNYYVRKLIRTSRFDNNLLKYSFQGHVGFNKNVKHSMVDTITFARRDSENSEAIIMDSMKIKSLEQSINLILDNHANAVLVNFPVTKFLQDTYVREDYNQYLNMLQSLTLKYKGVSLLDLNIETYNDNQLFSDMGHLNRAGQLRFTEKICTELE